MLNWQQRTHRGVVAVVLLAGIFCVATSNAIAQDQDRSSFVGSIVKQVAFDPTTYAPSHHRLRRHHARLEDIPAVLPGTASWSTTRGLRSAAEPTIVPLPYADGKKRILADAAANLGMSALNNFTGRVFERMLTERYPKHRKIVRAVSWIERISFGVYMSYLLSKRPLPAGGAECQSGPSSWGFDSGAA